jgi:hypothetical protein
MLAMTVRVIRLLGFSFLLSCLVAWLYFDTGKTVTQLVKRIPHDEKSSRPASHRAADRLEPFDVPWQGRKFTECVIPKVNRLAASQDAKCPAVGIAEHI